MTEDELSSIAQQLVGKLRDDPCSAPLHGTVFAYRRRGCRCPEAVEAVRAYWRSRRRCKPGGPKDRTPHIDEIAVERAMAGDPVRLTIRERSEAIRRLTAAGLSARQISARLRLTSRSVVRYRGGHIRHAELSRPSSPHPTRETSRETLRPDRTVA